VVVVVKKWLWVEKRRVVGSGEWKVEEGLVIFNDERLNALRVEWKYSPDYLQWVISETIRMEDEDILDLMENPTKENLDKLAMMGLYLEDDQGNLLEYDEDDDEEEYRDVYNEKPIKKEKFEINGMTNLEYKNEKKRLICKIRIKSVRVCQKASYDWSPCSKTGLKSSFNVLS
jgi:hypothetical protein